jgi:transcription-repair coupling factor (superfamily II helicase)
LEIRGAGDLLGGEQSGFINEIGFETYQKILAEAVEELKENEFKELYRGASEGKKEYVKDIQVDTDFELLFPDDYINNVSERLSLYTELNELKDDAGLALFREHLSDRFGPLPAQAEDLLDSVRLKWMAAGMGLEKLVLKQGKLLGYFLGEQDAPFYQSEGFSRLLQTVQRYPGQFRLKEKQTRQGLRLMLVLDPVKSIGQALEKIAPLHAAFEGVPQTA